MTQLSEQSYVLMPTNFWITHATGCAVAALV
jgi:hypothetical protein